MSVRNLDALFEPQSVAVIGASNAPGSIGGVVMRNLLKAGFAGPIMPVNPKYRAVAGVLTYADVASLPLAPDFAVVCTPPGTVPGIIQQLGERGTRAAAVITAGLSARHDQHQTIQEAMLAVARPAGLRILGPNCVGMMVPRLGLNASFAHTTIEEGNIAFVSQSGGFCTATLDWARARGIGFSHFVSLGNSADVDFGDVLDYLGSSADTSAILLYMESIGADEARKFMSAARSAARNKPVIAIKAGRNAEGARAAASHTGALAGSDNVYDAALRRAGILRVFTLDELFDAVETLARVRPLAGDRLAILTNGGGPGVIATDALIEAGGQLAPLSESTLARLDQLLPGTWSHANPVDMIGDADANTYRDALRILIEDRNVDAILVMNAPSAIAPPVEAARGIVDIVTSQTQLPILTSWLGGEAAGRARQVFAREGIPSYETPEHAIRAFMHLVRYRRNLEILTQVPPSLPTDFTPAVESARSTIAAVRGVGRELLTEPEAKQVLAAYGIPVVETRVAETPDDAARVAGAIGFPVALKILSADITHKSDAGGVVLGLNSAEDVRDAARRMNKRISTRFPQARLDGFSVQQMARRPRAHELIVGMTTDSIFGPVILFGRGGTAVEVIGDRAVALPPLNMSLARHLIERTRVYRLLKGYRDRPPADLDAICLVLTQVSQLIVDCPEIVELDINPLFADDQGVLALDARIRVAAAKQAGADRLAIRPYPRELEETIALPSGRRILVRPIRPEDQPAHEAFAAHLTPEDLRFRLLGAHREIPPSEMARLVQIDYDREMAFIAVDPNAAEPETLAVVRCAIDPDGTRAEFAVMVRSDLKRSGLGTVMMNKMIRYCRERGLREIVAQVLRENSAILNLTKKLGFEARLRPDGERFEVRLRLDPAG